MTSVLVPNQRTTSAGLIADWQSTREKPAVAAIATAQRECVLPGRPGLEALADPLHHTVDVIGMVHLLPAPPLHLFERRAGVVVPALVVPVDPTRPVGGPGKLTDVVGKLAEARFALAQRCFSSAPLDDNRRIGIR